MGGDSERPFETAGTTPRFAREVDILRSVVEAMPEGLVVTDRDGRFLYFNRAAEEILGIGAIDVARADWTRAYGLYRLDQITPIPASDLPLVRALEGEDVAGYEMFVRNPTRPGGVVIRVEARPYRNSDGEIAGGVATFRDVSEIRRRSDLVERLSLAIEKTGDGVMITDRDGAIVYVNSAFERQTGFSREEALGRTPSILRSGEHDKAFFAEMWRTILGGKEFRGLIRNRTKSGETFWSEHTITPIVDPEGRITHFVSLFKDVTERERELRHERDFNAAVLSTAGAPVLVTDLAGRLVRFNQACEELSDHAADDVVGRRLLDLPLLARHRDVWAATFGEILDGAGVIHRELEWTCRGGSTRTVHWTFRTLRDGGERPTHVVASGVDVTQRRAAREAFDRAERLRSRLEEENLRLKREMGGAPEDVGIVGTSAAIRTAIDQARRVAPTAATVLLLGETGTGKDLLASAIHRWSGLADRPLVHVDCVSLPPTLIEAELFGHERGSFTGAIRDRPGRFESADGGTIFLDEIGDLPLDLQTKLLRVLQSGEFERVGSSRTRTVHARVLAATNRDLRAQVERGAFRADLYFRLSVFPIRVPPLRERREDIPALVRHFLATADPTLRGRVREIPEEVFRLLSGHAWPGNVRELRNAVERALISATGGRLNLDDVRASLEATRSASESAAVGGTLEEQERSIIVATLERCGWRIKGEGNAADQLGLPPSTLRDRIRRLDIRRSRPRR